MRDDQQSPFRDEIDQVIHDALHVDVTRGQLRRMERFWTIQSNKKHRRRLVLGTLPAAAAALALVAFFVYRGNRPEVVQLPEQPGGTELAVQDFGLMVPPTDEEIPHAENSSSAGRPSSAYERLMFVARTSVPVPPSVQAAQIDRAIRQLALEPSIDAELVRESTGLDFTGPQERETERILLSRLRRASLQQQSAILKLLASCGSREAMPALLQVGSLVELQDQAITTMEQIVGIENLVEFVGLATDRDLRASIMHRVLSSDSDVALRGYLSLVSLKVTRAEALAVALTASELPVHQLVALLDDKDTQLRLSAALVLGHVNGPAVTRLLISRVTSQPSDCSEAWLALLSCRGDLAQEFVAYASQQPKLLGYCNYARVKWAQMIP